MKFENVYLIGVGGVGSHLSHPLYQYLSTLPETLRPQALTLIDKDKVEPKNLSRQRFGTTDVEKFKVQALKEQLTAAGESPVRLYPVPKWLDADLAKKGILNRSLIISAVDNHKTNKMIAEHVATLSDAVWLCGTGHLEYGAVYAHARVGGVEALPSPLQFHPEMANPQDRHPDEPNCLAGAEEGAPQLITTNLMGAMVILGLVSAMVEDQPVAHEIYYHLRKLRVKPQGEAPRTLAERLAANRA